MSSWLLRVLVDYFVPANGEAHLAVGSEAPKGALLVRNRCLVFAASGDRRLGTLRRSLGKDSVPLHEAVLLLGRMTTQPHKYKAIRTLIQAALVAIAALVGDTVELTRDDEKWRSVSPLELPVLRRPGSRKVRSIPLALRAAAATVARDSPDVRSVRALMGARNVQALGFRSPARASTVKPPWCQGGGGLSWLGSASHLLQARQGVRHRQSHRYPRKPATSRG